MRCGRGGSRTGFALGALLAAGLLATAAGIGHEGAAGAGGGAGTGGASARVSLVPAGPGPGGGGAPGRRGAPAGRRAYGGRGPAPSAAGSAGSTGSTSTVATSDDATSDNTGSGGAGSGGAGSGGAGSGGAQEAHGTLLRSGTSGNLQLLPGKAGSGGSGSGSASFLAAGACVAERRSEAGLMFRQVGCADRTAYGRVTVRLPAGTASPPPCPANTDFELELTTVPGTVAGGATGKPVPVPAGVACLRKVRAPHPGDPGQGGGAGIVAGDCLAAAGGPGAGGTPVRETACGRAARPAAQYRVIAITGPPGTGCPSGTRYLIRIHNPGQGRRTACAVPTG